MDIRKEINFMNNCNVVGFKCLFYNFEKGNVIKGHTVVE